MARKFKDITGRKFYRLTAIELIPKVVNGKHRTYWKFRCDCGSEIVVRLDGVINGAVKSCGCFSKEYHSARMTENGFNKYTKGHKPHNKGCKWGSWMSEEGAQRIEKPVVQFTGLGEFMAIYKSIHQAAREVGTTATNIDAVCRHRYHGGYERKTAKGFIWLFLDEYSERFKLTEKELKPVEFDGFNPETKN